MVFNIAKVTDSGPERNFSRTVIVEDDKGNDIQSGSISRVLVKRGGETIANEVLALDISPRATKKCRVIVENRDDDPLPITRVEALSYQRRIYFDPRGRAAFRLYYGDEKLDRPAYDYQQFFEQNPDAALVQFGPVEANPQATGRPDDRPWSERHGWVLWAAMLIAVVLLGGLALRGLKSSASGPA
jgi:hypothetical protein